MPTELLLNVQTRCHSCPSKNRKGCNTLESLRGKRSMSVGVAQTNAKNNSRSSWFSLEILYTITDIVLVICAAIFIISGVTSIVLWIYGFYYGYMDVLEKKKLAFKH